VVTMVLSKRRHKVLLKTARFASRRDYLKIIKLMRTEHTSCGENAKQGGRARRIGANYWNPLSPL